MKRNIETISFDFYPFLILDGKDPIKFQGEQEFEPCKSTLFITAEYQCDCGDVEIWHFTFYLWRMPTSEHGKYHVWLSCLDSIHVE